VNHDIRYMHNNNSTQTCQIADKILLQITKHRQTDKCTTKLLFSRRINVRLPDRAPILQFLINPDCSWKKSIYLPKIPRNAKRHIIANIWDKTV